MNARLAAEPNVTPMIDVMLVLLIIFMVVAPMLMSGTLAQPPSGTNLQAHPDAPADVTLGISVDGSYVLDKEPISHAALAGRLRAIYAARKDHLLYIEADRRLDYAKILEAIDVASNNGVRTVAMIAVTPRDPQSTSRHR
ncbi:MAG TPA: biopolymer transporter ExbD [Gemmatimonadaceae bacterium]|nr:biopolymer transporter ExbD [Gemmatimonadaceae bacterium]